MSKRAVHFRMCAPLPPSSWWMCLLTLHPAEKEASCALCPLLRTQVTGKHEHGWCGHGLSTQTLCTQDGPKKKTHKNTPTNRHTFASTVMRRTWSVKNGGRGWGWVREAQRGAVKAISPGRAWTQMSAAWLPVHGHPTVRLHRKIKKKWMKGRGMDITAKHKGNLRDGAESLTFYFETRFEDIKLWMIYHTKKAEPIDEQNTSRVFVSQVCVVSGRIRTH